MTIMTQEQTSTKFGRESEGKPCLEENLKKIPGTSDSPLQVDRILRAYELDTPGSFWGPHDNQDTPYTKIRYEVKSFLKSGRETTTPNEFYSFLEGVVMRALNDTGLDSDIKEIVRHQQLHRWTEYLVEKKKGEIGEESEWIAILYQCCEEGNMDYLDAFKNRRTPVENPEEIGDKLS